MPRPIRVRPSAGMLWSTPRELLLAGRVYVVSEFRVATGLARLENLLESLCPDPFAGAEDSARALRNRDQLSRAEFVMHVLRDSQAQRDWPPKMGGPRYGELLSTDEGLWAFAWVALTRDNRDVTEDEVDHVVAEMTSREWSDLSAAAWNRRSWEAGAPEDDDDPEPFDWPKAVRMLFDAGHSYAEIGEMTYTQLRHAVGDDKPWRMWAADPIEDAAPPSPPAGP